MQRSTSEGSDLDRRLQVGRIILSREPCSLEEGENGTKRYFEERGESRSKSLSEIWAW